MRNILRNIPGSLLFDRAWLTRKRTLLVTLCFSLLLLCAVAYWIASQNKWLIKDYNKQNVLSEEQDIFGNLFLDIQSAESALRGYAGSGDPRFMTGYPSLVAAVRTHTRELTKFQDIGHSAIDKPVFRRLKQHVQAKLEIMQQIKTLIERNDRATALALISNNENVQLTDSILSIHRAANSAMVRSLEESKALFNIENSKYHSIAYWGIMAAIFIATAVLYFLLKGINNVETMTNELALEREHLGVTLKSIGEGLITTSNDGKIIYMNPAAERMTGWKIMDVKHKPLQSVYNVINEETGKPFGNIVNRIIREGKTVELENNTILRARNAESRVISNNGSPLRDLEGNVLGAVLVFNDITEKKKSEEKIRKAIERYEILSKATSDTIWDWDLVNDVILYNNSITKMFGYSKAELNDAAGWWRNNLHPDDYERVHVTLDNEFKKGSETIQLEYRYRCADKSFKYILDRAYVIYDQQGNPVRIIGAMQDVTKEKEHERQIAIAITDAQEKERKELGMELHDNVNQLLGATLLYMGMLIKSGEMKQESRQVLKDCVQYINDAINSLRNLSHRLTPHAKKQVSLKELIELLVQPILATKQFDVKLHVESFESGLIESEVETNLYRIIQEQLTNILKHAEANSIEISVWLTKKLIKLNICDNGKGFDTATLKDGIGLENMKRRAEMFSGKIKFISSPGNGCELQVEMPLKTSTAKTPSRKKANQVA